MPRGSWGLLQASDLLTPLVPTCPTSRPPAVLSSLRFSLAGVFRRMKKAGLPCDFCTRSYDQRVCDNAFPAVTET